MLRVGGILMITFIVPYARELGLGNQLSILLVSVIAAASLAGKFFFGWLSDYFPILNIMAALQLIETLAWLPLIYTDHAITVLVTVVIVGLAVGRLTPIWASLIAVYFGSHAFARAKAFEHSPRYFARLFQTLGAACCTMQPAPTKPLISQSGGFPSALLYLAAAPNNPNTCPPKLSTPGPSTAGPFWSWLAFLLECGFFA